MGAVVARKHELRRARDPLPCALVACGETGQRHGGQKCDVEKKRKR
jgi:hypothetical protein